MLADRLHMMQIDLIGRVYFCILFPKSEQCSHFKSSPAVFYEPSSGTKCHKTVDDNHKAVLVTTVLTTRWQPCVLCVHLLPIVFSHSRVSLPKHISKTWKWFGGRLLFSLKNKRCIKFFNRNLKGCLRLSCRDIPGVQIAMIWVNAIICMIWASIAACPSYQFNSLNFDYK